MTIEYLKRGRAEADKAAADANTRQIVETSLQISKHAGILQSVKLPKSMLNDPRRIEKALRVRSREEIYNVPSVR